MKTFHKIVLGAAMLAGATIATAAPAAAQSFGFSVGGPGYSLNYNTGGYYGGYGYYGRPSYYGYPSSYYGYPSYYSTPRPYYGRPSYYGRPAYRSSYRSYRGYRR